MNHISNNYRKIAKNLVVSAGLLLLTFALFGCGPAQTTSEQPGVTEEVTETEVEVTSETDLVAEQITIEFWDYTAPGVLEEWWDEFIATFNSSHPGITVTRTSFPESDYDAKLRTSIAANSVPDILFLISGSAVIDYGSAGVIAPIDDLIDKSIWTSSLLNAFSYGESIYAIPLGPMSSPMWYDEALFDKYGVKPPESWDDLISLCGFFNDAGLIPISLGGIEQWEIMMYFDYLHHQYGGYNLLDMAAQGEGASFEDEAFVKAGERLQELFTNKCFPEDFMGIDQDQMTDAFFNGEAAMELIGPWIVGMSKGMAPEGFKLRPFAFPALPDALPGTEKDMEGGVNGFAISASSEHPEAVAEFLMEFGRANQSWVDAVGYLPSVPGVSSSDPIVSELIMLTEEASTMFAWADRRLPSIIVDDYLNNLTLLAAGELTPEEFGSIMTGVVDEKIKD